MSQKRKNNKVLPLVAALDELAEVREKLSREHAEVITLRVGLARFCATDCPHMTKSLRDARICVTCPLGYHMGESAYDDEVEEKLIGADGRAWPRPDIQKKYKFFIGDNIDYKDPAPLPYRWKEGDEGEDIFQVYDGEWHDAESIDFLFEMPEDE